MKEIYTHADRYGKWYEVTDGETQNIFREYREAVSYYEYNNKYWSAADPYEESEEDRIAREAREKAIEREKKIDSILG